MRNLHENYKQTIVTKTYDILMQMLTEKNIWMRNRRPKLVCCTTAKCRQFILSDYKEEKGNTGIIAAGLLP